MKLEDIYNFLNTLKDYDGAGYSWVNIKDYKKELMKTKTKEILKFSISNSGTVLSGVYNFTLTFDDGILVKQTNS